MGQSLSTGFAGWPTLCHCVVKYRTDGGVQGGAVTVHGGAVRVHGGAVTDR